jgi:hypothetical protein
MCRTGKFLYFGQGSGNPGVLAMTQLECNIVEVLLR